MKTFKTALFSALAAVLVLGAAAVSAQSKTEPAIGGYCPVAYIQANMASKGDAKFTSVSPIDGETYQLSNAMAKEMFDKMPEKYTPAYGGYCAAAVAKGMKLKADPKLFVIENGKTYLFSTAEAKKMCEADKAGMIKMADANWPKVKAMPAMK